ncbi:MAG: hypothetical protein Q4F75_03710 [Pseudomonadota bacterium]|nr:hypothetical protein [Pseudomonadota bacterium]
MSMNRNSFIRIMAGISMLLASSSAIALIPTVDFSAIGEGVKSNIELVKQSSIVAKATSLTGEINSTIGSAKSSISQLGIEDAQKEVEKLKKQKENLEEAKKEYDKYKSELEAQKQALEDAKAEAERYKNEAQSAVNDVKDVASAAQSGLSEMASGVKESVSGAADTVSDAIPRTGNSSPAPSSSRQSFNQPQQSPAETTVNNTSAATDLAAAQSEIARLQAELNALKAQGQQQPAGTTGNTTVRENPETIQDLNEALAEIERLKAEIADLSENEILPENVNMLSEETDVSPEAKTSLPKPDETAEQLLPVVETAVPQGSFRKRPNAKPIESFYEKQSFNADKAEKIYTASVEMSQTLSFAQVSSEDGENTASLMNTPTGKNAKTDEFIFSDQLARYCEINVNNLEDEEAMKKCLQDLVAYRSAGDMQTAAAGNTLYTNIMQDTASSLAAEAMAMKNKASNYEDEVLKEVNEDISSASTIRDDINSVAETNKQIQLLLNDILKVYAAQVSLDAMDSLAKYNAKYTGEGNEGAGNG